MKPLGYILMVIGVGLLAFATAVELGLARPFGDAAGPSSVLIGVLGLVVLAAGYGVMRLSRCR